MATIDRTKNRFVEDKDTRVSVGLDFPLARVGDGNGYFATTKTTVESIKNNIILLLQTHNGERLFQPGLGMDLRKYLFEPFTEDISIQIENNIVDVFQRWLPFVELNDIQMDRREDINSLAIKIFFNIKRTPEMTESVEVQFTPITNDNGV